MLVKLACQTTIMSNKEHKKHPYLLKDLRLAIKNQVWATDITYIPIKGLCI
jgi:putative transposase